MVRTRLRGAGPRQKRPRGRRGTAAFRGRARVNSPIARRGRRRPPRGSPRARSSRCCKSSRPPGRTSIAARLSNCRCAAANRGRSSGVRRQRMSGSRLTVPRPEQGASISTTSNAASRNGSGPSSGMCTTVALVDSATCQRPAQEPHAMWPHIAGHNRPLRSCGCAERHGLAARRRAQVEHALARLRLHELGDELRCFVLHDKASAAEGVEAEWMTLEHAEPVGRVAGRFRLDAGLRELLGQFLTRGERAIDRETKRGRAIIELKPVKRRRTRRIERSTDPRATADASGRSRCRRAR